MLGDVTVEPGKPLGLLLGSPKIGFACVAIPPPLVKDAIIINRAIAASRLARLIKSLGTMLASMSLISVSFTF